MKFGDVPISEEGQKLLKRLEERMSHQTLDNLDISEASDINISKEDLEKQLKEQGFDELII
jgi:hypothetical protein